MTMQRIAYLDGWRGLAILFVLLDHFGGIESFNCGALGVELFFVLSGRLMAELLVVKNTPWQTFLWRRFSRIYPALLAFCTIMLIVSNAVPLYPDYAPDVNRAEYFSAIFFVMNYVAPHLGSVVTLDHTWSLCVEEHAYLLLALLVVIVSRVRGRDATGQSGASSPHLPNGREGLDQTTTGIAWAAALVGAAMMASGILQALFTQQSEHEIFWRSDVRAASVLIPFALRLLVGQIESHRKAASLPEWLPTVAFLIALIVNAELFPSWLQYSVGTLALALSVNTIDFASASVRSALNAKWITTIGMLSYSLYLWQQPFFKFSDVIGPVAGLAGSVAAAAISYFLIEKPSRAFLNDLWANRKASAKIKPL